MLGRPLNGRLPTLNIDNRCFQRPLPNTGINLLTPICAWRMVEILAALPCLLHGRCPKERPKKN